MENARLYKDLNSQYRKYMKARLNTFRFSGLMLSLVTIALLIFQYFEFYVNVLWNCVSVFYLCAMLFTINAQYQETRDAHGWAVASKIVAVILYVVTTAFLALILLDSFAVINIFPSNTWNFK